MITFEQLKSVNERVKKIEVKGKSYAVVAARVQAFRELWPNGSIETEILNLDEGIVTMRSVVRDEEGRILATGLAQEKESSSYINKTSFIENCETSAVGRALGMIGIGSDEQMASAEEVANAINNQSKNNEKVDAVMIAALQGAMKRVGITESQIRKKFGLESVSDMTVEQFNEANKLINKQEKLLQKN